MRKENIITLLSEQTVKLSSSKLHLYVWMRTTRDRMDVCTLFNKCSACVLLMRASCLGHEIVSPSESRHNIVIITDN